jgi:hypothetical protein
LDPNKAVLLQISGPAAKTLTGFGAQPCVRRLAAFRAKESVHRRMRFSALFTRSLAALRRRCGLMVWKDAKPFFTDDRNFIVGMTDRFALTESQRLFDSTPDLR